MRTKSFIILTISLIVFTFNGWAEKVPVEKALQAAAISYGQAGKIQLRSAGQQVLTLAYTNEYYYIFNIENDGGFIVVAGDDRACPVLGYSLKGNFDEKNTSPVFLRWLQSYETEIATAIKEKPELPADPAWSETGMESLIKSIELRQTVGPLGTATWNQGNPYNRQCPAIDGVRTVTGCAATAMAIMMKYHADNGFKAVGVGSHSYTWNGLQTLKVDFGTYDYDNMPKTTAEYVNDTQREAVAKLMYHCGVSINSDYGIVRGTGASPYDVLFSLNSNFGYDPQMEFLWKSDFSNVTEWGSLIKAEIDNRRPIFYAGWGTGGHAFICEGYTDNDEYYMNWGWGGFDNGYFRLSALNTGGYQFNSEQAMIIGIKKAESNPDDYSSLRLTNWDGRKGMSKNVEDVIQNQQFPVTTGAVSNNSFSKFTGNVGVAVFDGTGNLKEVISKIPSNLNPGYYFSTTINCTITQSIEIGDVLRMVSSIDGDKTWKIILGGTGVVDYLPLTADIPVASVALNVQEKAMTVSETFQLTATVKPDNSTDKNVTWSSSNTNIAEVNASGLVTAKATGTATITVRTNDGNKTATCVITVTSSYLAYGTTGPLIWTLTHSGTLTISGNGAMPDYNDYNSDFDNRPWVNHQNEINSVVLETGVTSIGDYAFSHCRNVTSIILPNGLTRIGDNGLSGTQTSSIDLPNTLVTIGSNAFGNCEITSLFIPASVYDTGHLSTYGCMNLTTITVDPSNPYYSSLDGVLFNKNQTRLYNFPCGKGGNYVIPGTVTHVWNFSFLNNATLSSIFIPSSVIDLAGDYRFQNCFNISSYTVDNSNPNYSSMDGVLYDKNKTKILNYPPKKTGASFEIPNTVTTIGTLAFGNTGYGGNGLYLNTLKIPSSVNYIEFAGISYGGSLSSVIINNPTPPNLAQNGALSNISSSTLHVPVGAKAAYQSAAQWQNFGTIVEDAHLYSTPYEVVTGEDLSAVSTEVRLQGDILHVTGPVMEEVTIYSLSGSVLYQTKKPAGKATFHVGNLPRGLLIVRGSSGWTQKVIKN